MSKRRFKLKVRIPPYVTPRNKWRYLIYEEAQKVALEHNIKYQKNDKLEITVKLYLNKTALSFHDVDNRLKDIMDALQGRAGGSKKNHTFSPIIPNDHQIFKATIEKIKPPKQSHEMGHLIIRKYAPNV
jgi:Holliday junction resolvase RusA-like endonuclease